MTRQHLLLSILPITASAILLAGCGGGSPVEKGEAALRRGDYAEAARQFKRAASKEPSAVPLLYNLGMALSRAGDHAGAAKAFRDVLRFTPGDLDAAEYLAAELRQTGRAEDLVQSHENLEEIVLKYRQDPTARARALSSLALTENALRRTDLALAHILLARQAAPDYAPALFNFAWICQNPLRLGVPARRAMEEFLAMPGADPEQVERAGEFIAALPKPPPPAAESSPAAKELVARGKAEFDRKNFAVALDHFTRALDADPKAADAALDKAKALFNLNRAEEAAAAFAVAAELDATSFEPAYWQARIAYTAGDYDTALSLLTSRVIPFWPEKPDSYMIACYAFTQCKRYYEAHLYGELYVEAAKAAGQSPDDFSAWLSRLPPASFKP